MAWAHPRRLARLAVLVNLAACAAPSRPSPGVPIGAEELAGPFAHPERPPFVLPDHPGYTDVRVAGRLSELAVAPPAPDPDDVYVLDQLASPLTDARFDDSIGDRMADALDAAEDEGRPVEEYGTGALDYYELLGDGVHEGFCEIPRVVTTVEHEGDDWELTLGMAMIEAFVGDLEPAIGALSEDCVADLLDAAGDVAAASDCSTEDEASFFPEGSDCRVCVEEQLGDVTACQDAGRCATEAPVLESRSGELWTRFEGTLLTCAPDYTVPAYVLALPDEAGDLPDPFDYERWGFICAPFWDDYLGESNFLCTGGADTMRVGMTGLVEGMRQGADDTAWYRHMGFYSPRITLDDGTDLRWAWEAYVSGGIISYPVEPDDSNGDGVVDAGDDYYGYQYGSWGLNPMQVRPDGSDPDVLDDTFARDWWAAHTLKTATTRNGVSILMANHSRCAADGWDDLDGDGVYRCTRTEDPVEGWIADLAHFRWDPDAGYSYPMTTITLGSTGLPDPTIPGGIVPWVAGTPLLGDPEWDGCSWANTFVPDRAALPDTPLDYTNAGTVAADTWYYGGHPELDLRVTLYTNYTRDFCPGEAP